MPFYVGETEVVGDIDIAPSAVLRDGLVLPDGDLTVSVEPFYYDLVGAKGKFTGAINQSITDDDTSYVYLDGYGELQITTVGYPSETHIRLAKVIASGGFILRVILERALLTAAGEGGAEVGGGTVSLSNTAPEDVTTTAASVGVGTTAARSDHKHDVSTAAPSATAVVIGNSISEGTSNSLARADHVHAVSAGTAVSIGDANSAGAATTFSRSDHVHALGGTVGGDLSGTLPNPTVVDLTITSEQQGSILYRNATNWVQLSPSTDGSFLQTRGAGANPVWSAQLRATLDSNNNNITNAKNVSFNSELDNGNSGTSFNIDWTAGQKQAITLNNTCTFTFTNPPGVSNLILRIVQDATGSRTITWPASIKWAGGVAPTLSTAASAIDIVSLYWNGTNYFGVASLAFA